MTSQGIAPAEFLNGSAGARKAPRIPAQRDFKEDHPLVRIADVIRSVVMWVVVLAVAASGALLVGNMPVLKAAVPDQPREIPAIVEPAPSAGEVRDTR